ncbi:MAG: hypothetical protein K9J37_03295 [Saprospiraceae bacterium]|nr:hypothetical protein [Saprospiraceae bacterium]MCF8310193.1 hypothetical protein [Saprospiraceae bacterium]MCF8439093.1 hypothetical protein [Saprospiraceae bacterium]
MLFLRQSRKNITTCKAGGFLICIKEPLSGRMAGKNEIKPGLAFREVNFFKMKKLFFIAILATTLCIYFGCSKADKSEPAPATTNTEVSNHTDATDANGNVHVTPRATCEGGPGGGQAYCDCDCCCDLVLQGPLNTDVDLNICGPNIGCPDDVTDCNYGPGCGVNFTAGHGGTVTLNTSSNDHKIFCSGEVGDLIHVRNMNAFTVKFVISCDGTTGTTVTLLQGEAAFITKAGDCGVNNVCIY